MKLLPMFATTNAILAGACALLGAAPFTPALMLFIVWLPLAALVARKNQTVAALSVPVFAILAVVLSPIRLDHASVYLFGAWLVWGFAWSLAILYFSRQKLRAAVAAVRAVVSM
ncbi:hypothetical protein [Rhodoferax sp.]|uniref:hypothetical protein n=1 Tax=Rhodoferax sp. TaxID=50421 RepID=UPI00274AC3D5|nr:hypothetical protein [Rhodoferax sp.]